MTIRWTDNRKAMVKWLLGQGPKTMQEAIEAAEGGLIDLKPTSVKRVLYDGYKVGLFGKVGGAYYPLLREDGTAVELRLVEVAA